MITIFTPTYNRANMLEKLYESLIVQTDQNFNWIIIDDGSIDDTQKRVEKWKKNLNITYIYQANQGKHIAINTALKNCNTDYLMCVDSDDTLKSDAVAFINRITKNKINKEIWAIVGPRVHSDGSLSKEWLSKDDNVCKFADIYGKYKYEGETYIIMNHRYVKDFTFPCFKNEKLVPENVMYDFFDNNFYIKTISEKKYVSEYQNDGYTKNNSKLLFNSPNGVALSNISSSCNKNNSFFKRVKSYTRFLVIKKEFLKNSKKNFNVMNNKLSVSSFVKLFSLFLYPLFLLHYKKKKES